MLSGGVDRVADEFRARRPAARIVVSRVPDPRAFGGAEVDPDGRVRRLTEKPSDPRSDLALVGVYFFTPAIHAAVAAITPSDRGELELTDALQWLVDRGDAVTASTYDGYWQDAGQPEDVLACNRRVLADLHGRVGGEVDATSRLRGEVVIEPGARVLRSRIEGPAVIGSGTIVLDSRVGPNVSVGRDCTVTGTVLDDSILMDGATVAVPRGLHRSIVGRGATVRPAAATARHHLTVCDHTEVELAQ